MPEKVELCELCNKYHVDGHPLERHNAIRRANMAKLNATLTTAERSKIMKKALREKRKNQKL